MPGRTKIYDQAQESASELRVEMRRSFIRSGGGIDAEERRLLSLADGVCSHTSGVAAFVRAAVRWLGGGLIDRGLMADLRDAENVKPAIGEIAGSEVECEEVAA